jgi:hypothetical protein
LKREWWGSPVQEEKHWEEKDCDKRHGGGDDDKPFKSLTSSKPVTASPHPHIYYLHSALMNQECELGSGEQAFVNMEMNFPETRNAGNFLTS